MKKIIDSDAYQDLNSDSKKPFSTPKHIFSDQEIESLISPDFCLKVDRTLRKAKDDLINEIKDDLIEYIINNTNNRKNEITDTSIPSISQEASNNYFSHHEEDEEQIIEEEEQFEGEAYIDGDISQIDNTSSHFNEEENQNEQQDLSEKIPSGLFNGFTEEEEEEKSKFEFEDYAQVPQDLPPEEISQIENVKHYGSAASGSQVGGEEELNSINFLSGNNDDDINLSPIEDNKSNDNINLSPIEDNKSDENHSAEPNSESHISGGNGFDDFESDAIMDEFG